MRFSDKVVIVTGAGNGIGREYAYAFAAECAAVVVADLDGPGARETAEKLRASGHTGVDFALDVTDPSAVAAMVAAVCSDFGGVDVLVNNAGLHLGRYNETTTLELEHWRRILDVNVLGALVCTSAVRASMASRGGGVVVNQSSMAAYLPAGGAYGVSKLALNGLTMSLAAELGGDGIRVVGIAPGMVSSPAVVAEMAPEHWDLIARGQMVKRIGEMGDLVGMVLFLCSDQAAFITGQTYLVDGGFAPRP